MSAADTALWMIYADVYIAHPSDEYCYANGLPMPMTLPADGGYDAMDSSEVEGALRGQICEFVWARCAQHGAEVRAHVGTLANLSAHRSEDGAEEQ